MTVQRAYKYRIYPTAEQQEFFSRQFGAARFVYNYFLNQRKTEYLNNGKSLNYYDNSKELTTLKTQDGYAWLYDINSQTLQASLRNLEVSYTNFFAKRAKFPKFKKRSNKQCIKIPQNFKVEGKKLFIPKFKTGIEIVLHQSLPTKPTCCFISKTPTNKYYASFLYEVDIQPLSKSDQTIGIDLGLTNLLITSNGGAIANPKHSKKLQKKLAFKQRQLSKKQKGSNNRNKARIQVALIHEQIANSRNDYLHKVSKKLVDENQVIITETLAVANMMKNHNLAGAIQDASWGELLRQLEYKSGWYGRTFYQIDMFFPSSKTCNGCQFIMDTLSLSMREWDCPNCQQHNDRDINAACNIRDQGIKNLSIAKAIDGTSGCGMQSDDKQKLGEAFSSADGSVSVSKKSRRNEKPSTLC
jgi:putative transposase